MEETLRLFDLQPFSLHDGPGIRTTVFLQGCDLRCRWCHNPESQNRNGAMLYYPAKCIGCGACHEVCPQAKDGKTARGTADCTLCGACAEECYAEAVKRSGRTETIAQVVEQLLKDRETYRTSGGGVTFSGGEPLLQAEAVARVLREMKDAGVHTAVETCLCVPWENVEAVLPLTDLVFADVKCVTAKTHREGTGADNAAILENIRRLSASGANLILRTPVVPGFNAEDGEIRKIGEFVRSLDNPPPLELLAFHGMCAPKYAALGREFPCAGVKEPTREEMEHFTGILADMGLNVKYSM